MPLPADLVNELPGSLNVSRKFREADRSSALVLSVG